MEVYVTENPLQLSKLVFYIYRLKNSVEGKGVMVFLCSVSTTLHIIDLDVA